MAERYEVQHYTLCDGWINTTTDGEDQPVTFATVAEAQADLDGFFEDIEEAIKCGDMEDGYDRSEFRIVPVGTDATDHDAIDLQRSA